MSATGHRGQPVRPRRRRVGRIVVVTVVFTVGIQVGDAAFHAVQEVGNLRGLQEMARSEAGERDPAPCLTLGGLALDGLAERLLKLFRLERTEEFTAHDTPPDYLARN